LLCAFIDQYRTDHDPDEASRLALGLSAYCYRLLDEKALAAFEASFSDKAAKPASVELRRLRNRRYYQGRKAQKAQQAS
jgi:hypothetical protein